jgi:hypothetical protein
MIDVFGKVVGESRKLKVSDDVRERLPHLLWLFHMGVVLFWVHDKSLNQERTRVLVSRATPVIGQLVGLSRLPVLRGSAKELMTLISTMKGAYPGKKPGREVPRKKLVGVLKANSEYHTTEKVASPELCEKIEFKL